MRWKTPFKDILPRTAKRRKKSATPLTSAPLTILSFFYLATTLLFVVAKPCFVWAQSASVREGVSMADLLQVMWHGLALDLATAGYASAPLWLLLGIAIVSILSYYLTKAILWSLEKAIQRSPTHWDDDIFNRRFNRGVSQLAPAMMVSWLLPRLFGDNGDSVHWLDVVTSFYILWAVIHIIVIFCK